MPAHIGYSLDVKARIYHNPRCSKSRETLALLQERGVDVDIVEYLSTPPTADEIRRLLKLLKLEAFDLIRRSEPAFRDSGLDADSPADDLIALMAREPIVIERPIVVVGRTARLGRPPARVLELLD
jgi:arsenate reductase